MFKFAKVDKSNWESVLKLSVFDHQKNFVPSVGESMTAAYVVPWDEAFDPFVIMKDDTLIGFFYISYTPKSKDNYWLGGYFIDKHYQNMGYGSLALDEIMIFIKHEFPECELLSLTFVKNNSVALKLYEKHGFKTTGEINPEGEIIMRRKL